MINTEAFVPLFEFPDYQISNLGKVYSVKTNRILKAQDNGSGYLFVQLKGLDNEWHSIKIHRLVAETFIKNPANLLCVNHKDLDKHNNSVDNLEWCTYEYNINYLNPRIGKKRTEDMKTKMSIAAKNRIAEQGCRFNKPVVCIETGQKFCSGADASRSLGLNTQAVSTAIRRGNKCGGFTWRYVNE